MQNGEEITADLIRAITGTAQAKYYVTVRYKTDPSPVWCVAVVLLMPNGHIYVFDDEEKFDAIDPARAKAAEINEAFPIGLKPLF